MGQPPRIPKGQSNHLSFKRHLRANLTPAEGRLWAKLCSKQFQGLKFRRQHGIGPYIVDFYCPTMSLVVEVDGDVHTEKSAQKKDKAWEGYFQSLGLRVIRYNNDDVLNNLNGVLEDLLGQLSKDSTSPTPLLTKEGDRGVPL